MKRYMRNPQSGSPCVKTFLQLLLVIVGLAGAAASAQTPSAALADAAEHQDQALIRQLLDSASVTADVNATQVDGMTALHWAVYHDDTELTAQLLLSGADVNVKNRYGVPPLSLAATNRNATIVRLLLDAGAKTNEPLAGKESILMIAARTGSLDAVQALLDAGADPNLRENRGQTALMWAAAEGHIEVVEALITAGAHVLAKLNSGFTPLFFAVREGHTDVALALIEAGADVTGIIEPARDSGGVANNNASTQPITQGLSPLLMAVQNGHFELAIALVKAGADPDDRRTGFTPLATLSWVRKPDSSDRGDPSPIGSGNLSALDFVNELVALGADVNLPMAEGAPRQPNSASRLASEGATAFLLAADRADVPLMRRLLDLGANPHWPNLDGTNALMAAAGLGTTAPEEEAGTEAEALEATQLMLELGADVNEVNDENDTAMHGAAYGMFPSIVALLAEHGADPHIWNRENHRGWTPLFIAEGYRFGLPRPSKETIEVITGLMTGAGMSTEGPRPEIIDIYAAPPPKQ